VPTVFPAGKESGILFPNAQVNDITGIHGCSVADCINLSTSFDYEIFLDWRAG
jgi:hypothetical protein